jgi:EipB-like
MIDGLAARVALAACLLLPPTMAWPQDASQDVLLAPMTQVPLVPHRAIYDLSLGDVRGNAQVASVRGRILYDFDGNACQGYSLEFRQVSELNSGEGKTSTSDLRSTTWEGADARKFKFTSENFVDDTLTGTVDGHAEHDAGKTSVALEKPEKKSLDLAAGVVFPTEHMVRVINAAHDGKNILSFPVYDGSETGQKVFDTLTVIGNKLSPDERQHDDAADGQAKLAGVPRWPVTISYFEKKKAENTSEQTPDYSIGFELYENGISRALTLDYNDFIVTGKLTSLEFKDPKPCP